MQLNLHHLRYFLAIAKAASLTKAAQRLNVSQSALSVQLRKLEEQIGHHLFDRSNKRLTLTEAGRITLDHAQSIFQLADELSDQLQNRTQKQRTVFRVGAVATLSRNFQMRLLKDLSERDDVELVLRSGSLRALLLQLKSHTIDMVLSNQAVRKDAENNWFSHLLARQPVILVTKKQRRQRPFQFPQDLHGLPIILPSHESTIRQEFDAMLDRHQVRPIIAAEADDMAMLRLLAKETGTATLVPAVVVKDELQVGSLSVRHQFESIHESFYAITPERRFPNHLAKELIRSAANLDFSA
jgi:LysR family transcriptional activator of nhaA